MVHFQHWQFCIRKISNALIPSDYVLFKPIRLRYKFLISRRKYQGNLQKLYVRIPIISMTHDFIAMFHAL